MDETRPTPNVHEEAVRAIAKQIVEALITPLVIVANKSPASRPLTFADLLYLGAYTAQAAVQGGFDPLDYELHDAIRSRDSRRVEDVLCKRLLAKLETPEAIQEAMKWARGYLQQPRTHRELSIDVMRHALPPGSPGRKHKILSKELPDLAALSDSLLPAIRTLLQVQAQTHKRSLAETVEYLQKDYPSQAEYLMQHLSCLESAYHDLREHLRAESRARSLADILAGDKWGLAPSYAEQRAKEARRLTRRKSSGR